MIRTTSFCIALLSIAGSALAGTSCENVKADISKKIDGHGVRTYSLTVIGKDDKADGEVVGSCEGGAKAIVYKRG